MAAERLEMRKAREILRQKWDLGLSHRKVARSLGVGVGTVSEVLTRAVVAGLASWAGVQELDDEALETLCAELGEPDVLVHCVGSGRVGLSLEQPLQDFQKNVDTTAAALEFVRMRAPSAT